MRTATLLTSFLLVAFLGSCGDHTGSDNVRTGAGASGHGATDVTATETGSDPAAAATTGAIDDGSVPIDPAPIGPITGEMRKPGEADASEPQDTKPADTKPADDMASAAADSKDESDQPVPIPAGATPEDIRAIRGAQQMIQAESKLRKMIAEGEVEGVDKLLTFEEISSWAYKNGLEGMPPEVKELDGKTVMMVGFMLPIHKIEDMEEFLLVQSLWACCYGQPPDLNGLVRVVMTDDNKVDYEIDPVRMIGKFKIEAYEEDGFIVDIYQLHTDKIEVLR